MSVGGEAYFLGPLHTRDWEPVTVYYSSSTLIGGKGGAGPSSLLHTTLAWGTNGVYIYKWMQDGGECKVYKDSYMASNGSCRMVTWTISKTHLLEVGSTQNRDTMALQTLTSVDVFYFYHVWEPTWIEIRWNGICLRARSYMASHYTWGSVTTLHDFGGVCWDGLWALSFGLLQFSQSRLFGPCVKWPLVMPRSTQQAARICTEGPCGLINNSHPSQHMVPQTGRK